MDIVLQQITEYDKVQMLDILTSDTVKQTYMLPNFACRNDAIPLFNRLSDLSKDSSRYVRGIFLGNKLIGFLNDVEIEHHCIELGYVIHPDYHNQGYMTAALEAAVGELFRTGYRCVVCGAFSENKGSIRVMEKCGMKIMQQTETISYRGSNHHCVYYCRTKNGD